MANRMRILILLLVGGCAGVSEHGSSAHAGLQTVDSPPTVAITIDDGPKLAPSPLMTPAERNAAMIRALSERGVRAAVFVTSGNGADEPAGLELLKAWSAAGMLIGNHTVTHPDFNDDAVTLAAFESELLRCDEVIRGLAGYRKWFRFPYLREGREPAKVDGFRAFLREQGYRNGYVSLDTSDWQFALRLSKKLAEEPKLDLAPYRAAYLAHIKQRAEAYRQLSQRLLGRDIAQVLLIHHSLLNALFLGDVLDQFKRMGWEVVDPDKAFADPIYLTPPPRLVAGQSILMSIARSLGEDVDRAPYLRLRDDAAQEMNELDQQGL